MVCSNYYSAIHIHIMVVCVTMGACCLPWQLNLYKLKLLVSKEIFKLPLARKLYLNKVSRHQI